MWTISLLSLFVFATATPTAAPAACRDLQLPWGTYAGTLTKNDICEYSNIRFASPPIGNLRFAGPQYPPITKDPAPVKNPICVQAEQIPCISEPIGEKPKCYPKNYGTPTEDCLFLDISVPRRVLQLPKPVPVVVWFYGGAYLYGSKTQFDPSEALPFYDATGILEMAETENDKKTSLIFVKGNYRLGAFGWLAGKYMEDHGQPNAGLLDQRKILEFVHDHIGKVNGDPNTVSVWGESAGASSIMHHLAMPLNIQKPLFERAILQSPAFQWLWNRKGDLDHTFSVFSKRVASEEKCGKADMACLRSASTATLQKVNQKLYERQACEGVMPVGPSVDGNLVPDIATNAFAQGKVANIETIIVSHVRLEVPYSADPHNPGFIPRPVVQNPQSEDHFQQFLGEVFKGEAYTKVRSDISTKYPRNAYTDQIARAAAVITDSSFTCNTRHIIDTYLARNTKVYALDYRVLDYQNASTHASDLIMTFFNKDVDIEKFDKFVECVTNATSRYYLFVQTIQNFRQRFQQLFTDHAIWGVPNGPGRESKDFWPPTSKGPCPGNAADSANTCVANLMSVGGENVFFDARYPDPLTPASVCNFWKNIAQDVAKAYRATGYQQWPEKSSQQIVLPEDQL